MLSRSFSSRILFSIILGCCLLYLCLSSYSAPNVSSQSSIPKIKPQPFGGAASTHAIDSPAALTAPARARNPKSNKRCAALKKPDDIIVVLKTGANEIFEKLPTQILTMLQCVEDLPIFSDLEQQLGAYHIYDALADVTEAVKVDNPDFDYYRTLHEYKKIGQDISTLRETTGQAAWNLDKYKFMPMLEKTWEKKPNKKWYVFIEADTYLIWSNLLLWLERLDPTELIYLGSPTYVNNQEFGHGGSGVILSGAAMAKVFDGPPGVAAQYNIQTKDESMGDYMLMRALKDNGVSFRSGWPMLQAEKPSTIPFGPGPDNGVRHWCQPIVTMHHITAGEATAIWQYELKREDPMKPFLLEEMYHHLTGPNLASEREDWYNLSDDIDFKPPGAEGGRLKPAEELTELEKKAYLSFEDCRNACDEHERCYQFVFHDRTCGFSHSYRLGERRDKVDGKHYKSGWNLARIVKDQREHSCTEPGWL